jgi:hypothetical protein
MWGEVWEEREIVRRGVWEGEGRDEWIEKVDGGIKKIERG